MLDINQVGKVTHKLYVKPVNTPYTILARSAHPWQLKRATLTQEGVRRLLNTSVNTSQVDRNTMMEEWDLKMNVSGYSKKFRSNVIKSAIQCHNKKCKKPCQEVGPCIAHMGMMDLTVTLLKL